MAKKKMRLLDYIAYILLLIGGINWGLAVFSLNIVSLLIPFAWLRNVVYGAVGLSALYGIYTLIKLST